MKRYRALLLLVMFVAAMVFVHNVYIFRRNRRSGIILTIHNNSSAYEKSSTLTTNSLSSSNSSNAIIYVINSTTEPSRGSTNPWKTSKSRRDNPSSLAVTSTTKMNKSLKTTKINILPDRDRKFCTWIPEKKPIEVPSSFKNYCPQKKIVTVMQFGRLGNQIWEYAAVWTLAKITNREPFLPSCLIQTLEDVFKNLTAVLPLKYIEDCPIKYRYLWKEDSIENEDGNIVLPLLAQLPGYVVPHLKEIRQLLQFHDHLTQSSQEILRRASKGMRDPVFVNVHVRRTDYIFFLKLSLIEPTLTADFYIKQMNYFRQKYSRVLFVILSDDPDWCDRELSANDTVVVKGNSPEQDLSLMASCNHSILDYGTFGMWGALFAGGETLVKELASDRLESKMVKLMPNWRAVT